MNLYCYSISPIDWWVGTTLYTEFFRSAHLHDALLATEMLREGQRVAAEHLDWPGDVREGPYVFSIPAETNCALGVAWKEDNNGTTYVVSQMEMPWLEPFESTVVVIDEPQMPVVPRRLEGYS